MKIWPVRESSLVTKYTLFLKECTLIELVKPWKEKCYGGLNVKIKWKNQWTRLLDSIDSISRGAKLEKM